MDAIYGILILFGYDSLLFMLQESSSWDWSEHVDVPLTKDSFASACSLAFHPYSRWVPRTIRVITKGNALFQCNNTGYCDFHQFSTRETKVTGRYPELYTQISDTFNEILPQIELPNKSMLSYRLYLYCSPKLWRIYGPQTLWGRCLVVWLNYLLMTDSDRFNRYSIIMKSEQFVIFRKMIRDKLDSII